MATGKNAFINSELEWLETKLQEWKDYIDGNPIAKLKDRVQMKQTKTGGAMPMVIATIEQQIKSIRDTVKDYYIALEQVKKLRQSEDFVPKKETRGNVDRPSRMGGINE